MLKFNVFSPARMAPALLLLSFVGFVPPSLAETPPAAGEHKDVPVVSDVAEQKIIEHMQETFITRLKGWPGMIFYCPAEESKTPALKKICLDSYKNLEALSVQNNVKFHKARNANDVALLPHLTGRLKVIIDLTATEPNADPSAIAARISVLAHYAHAVNRATEVAPGEPGQPKHPLSIPQHVDAVLWENTVIKSASGGQDQLAQPVTQEINEKLKLFFADYAKANK